MSQFIQPKNASACEATAQKCNLNNIVDEISTVLKNKLEELFSELLQTSSDYDETTRILLTLPAIKHAITRQITSLQHSPEQQSVVVDACSTTTAVFAQTCTFNYDSLKQFEDNVAKHAIDNHHASASSHVINCSNATCQTDPPQQVANEDVASAAATENERNAKDPLRSSSFENISLKIEEVDAEAEEEEEEEEEEAQATAEDDAEDEEEVTADEEEAEEAQAAEEDEEAEEAQATADEEEEEAQATADEEEAEESQAIAEDEEEAQATADEEEEEEAQATADKEEEEEAQATADEEEEVEEEEEDEEATIQNEEEEEDEEEEEAATADEEEVFEITIKNKQYFTNNETNGIIYEMDAAGDPGDELGSFVNGVAKFV